MTLLTTLKTVVLFLAAMALLLLVVIGIEMAIIMLLHIGENLGEDLRQGRRDNPGRGDREWWEDNDH